MRKWQSAYDTRRKCIHTLSSALSFKFWRLFRVNPRTLSECRSSWGARGGRVPGAWKIEWAPCQAGLGLTPLVSQPRANPAVLLSGSLILIYEIDQLIWPWLAHFWNKIVWALTLTDWMVSSAQFKGATKARKWNFNFLLMLNDSLSYRLWPLCSSG